MPDRNTGMPISMIMSDFRAFLSSLKLYDGQNIMRFDMLGSYYIYIYLYHSIF